MRVGADDQGHGDTGEPGTTIASASSRIELGEHGTERRQVPVDVGQDSDPHGHRKASAVCLGVVDTVRA
ncbi:MAG TPA: hypothetical protein VIX82_10380 [Solirubrobacteraceae bacterium]